MRLWPTALGWRMVNPKFPAEWTAPLGVCAENVATEFGIGREAQDEWALRSHQRAAEAWEKGLHDDYVLAVDEVRRDESIRPDTSAAALAKLRPVFTPQGTVTAGNSSPLNDGGIAILMGTRESAADVGIDPLAEILGSAVAAVSPERFSVAPVGAIGRLLDRTGLSFSDVAVWEINEAFAAMVLSNLHELPELDVEKVNPHGGAIAIGHPLGASMPRVVVDCARELRRRGGGIGVAAACIGVGQGLAIALRV
jgi:acetyl-CoA acetyltransferase family protein